MQSIILAAGMGKRLKELTDEVTKCMVEVNGVTMIERMLAQLDKLGLSRIVMVIGYQSGKLKKFVETLDVKTPVLYIENPIYNKTNNIYSLYLAREYMRQEDTLLLESDLIFDDCVLQAILEDKRPNLALVAKFESWMDGTVVTLRDDCEIGEFLSKEQFKYSDMKNYYKTVNIYKFSREFSESHYIPFLEAYCHALGNNEYYEQVLKVIVTLKNPGIMAKVLEEGSWYEIDDIQDLDIAESIFNISNADRLTKIQKRYGGYWRYPQMLDFCYLVNPCFPPQRLLDEIKANFEILATEYPSGQRVNNLLAGKYFDVSPSRIIVGNGAAELISSLLMQIPGKIGIIVPTFDEYKNRKAKDIIAFNTEGLLYKYTARDVIKFFESKPINALVLINPDNPSGNYLPKVEILELAQWMKKKNIMFILDESFVDFAGVDGTMLDDDILTKYPHMVIIKSISKAYGVPGLRLGVLACGDADMLNAAQNGLSLWNINSFAEFYLQICEKYKDDFNEAIERFNIIRDEFFDKLSEISFLEPLRSKANYIMCRVTDNYTAEEITESLLLKHNIFIKDLSGKSGIKGDYVRIAIKKPEENAMLIRALKMRF